MALIDRSSQPTKEEIIKRNKVFVQHKMNLLEYPWLKASAASLMTPQSLVASLSHETTFILHIFEVIGLISYKFGVLIDKFNVVLTVIHQNVNLNLVHQYYYKQEFILLLWVQDHVNELI